MLRVEAARLERSEIKEQIGENRERRAERRVEPVRTRTCSVWYVARACVWSAPAADAALDSAGRRGGGGFLAFVGGGGAGALDAAALDALINLARPPSSGAAVMKKLTRASLSEADVLRIEAEAGIENAPPGWTWDGACYVDFFGMRSKRRPDLEALVEQHITERNKQIAASNEEVLKARLASMTTARASGALRFA